MGTVHVVKVKKDPNSTSNELDVTPARVPVNKSNEPIVVVWKLDDSSLEFGDGANNQGFSWPYPQVPRAFSGPWYSNDGKRIILDDSNPDGNAPETTHVYQLFAYDKVTKQVYSTGYVKLEDGGKPLTTNPAIINK
jgi:hypothetical protein